MAVNIAFSDTNLCVGICMRCVEGIQRSREGLHENENTSFLHYFKSILFTLHLQRLIQHHSSLLQTNCCLFLRLEKRRLNNKFQHAQKVVMITPLTLRLGSVGSRAEIQLPTPCKWCHVKATRTWKVILIFVQSPKSNRRLLFPQLLISF